MYICPLYITKSKFSSPSKISFYPLGDDVAPLRMHALNPSLMNCVLVLGSPDS